MEITGRVWLPWIPSPWSRCHGDTPMDGDAKGADPWEGRRENCGYQRAQEPPDRYLGRSINFSKLPKNLKSDLKIQRVAFTSFYLQNQRLAADKDVEVELKIHKIHPLFLKGKH